MVSPPIREDNLRALASGFSHDLVNNFVPSTCTVYQSRPCTLRASHYEVFRGKVSKGGIIRIHHECEGVIENSVPRITDWHHEACRVMTNGDREGRIFYPILTRIMNSYSCSPLNISFYIVKT